MTDKVHLKENCHSAENSKEKSDFPFKINLHCPWICHLYFPFLKNFVFILFGAAFNVYWMLCPPAFTLKIQQQVRLVFTLPWRMLASYFLFKIMEEFFEVKNFIGIKYSVGWKNDFSRWEVKRKRYGSFYSNITFFNLIFLVFFFLVFEAWLQTGIGEKTFLCSHKPSLLDSKSKEIWRDV